MLPVRDNRMDDGEYYRVSGSPATARSMCRRRRDLSVYLCLTDPVHLWGRSLHA
jgi:hypothetical protein